MAWWTDEQYDRAKEKAKQQGVRIVGKQHTGTAYRPVTVLSVADMHISNAEQVRKLVNELDDVFTEENDAAGW